MAIEAFEESCMKCRAFLKRRKVNGPLPCPLRTRGKRWTPAEVYASAPKDWVCEKRVK